MKFKQDKYLFIFGNYIFICKQYTEIKSKVNESNRFFKYGISGKLINKGVEIEVKRIQVIQFS